MSKLLYTRLIGHGSTTDLPIASRNQTRATAVVVSLLVTVLSCAVSAALQPPSAPPQSGPAVTVDADFMIGPEDVLGVVFWREPEISGDVTVRPDGRITLPVLGELIAAGMRPNELQTQIQVAARKYLTEPNVAVVIRAINSRRIFVTGRVTTPGAHPLKGPIDVMQAIALAGGLTEYADAKHVTILRSVQGKTERFLFNYRDVVKGKGLAQNIQLRPGDTVIVP